MFLRAFKWPKLSINSLTARSKLKRHLSTTNEEFETVFKFPFVKYISVFNRLKVYHIIGTSISIPTTGLLEMLNVVPQNTCTATSILGISGAILWSLGTFPFKDSIGFLYINKDNSKIKISSVNFWGKRIDLIIPAEDWIPLVDLKPKVLDPLFLTPQLIDGSKFKLFIKYGQVLNPKKIGEVLE